MTVTSQEIIAGKYLQTLKNTNDKELADLSMITNMNNAAVFDPER